MLAIAMAAKSSALLPGRANNVRRAKRQLGSIHSLNIKAPGQKAISKNMNFFTMRRRGRFVRDHHHQHISPRRKTRQQSPQAITGVAIQISSWLIGQQHWRLIQQSARNGNALLLST